MSTPSSSGASASASTSVSSSASASQSANAMMRTLALPQSRIRTIMKSSPDVDAVSQESLFLVSKATEYFIVYLTKLAYRHAENPRQLSYQDLASVVQRKEYLEFLHDIVPKKIKYSKYLKIMEEREMDDEVL